MPIVEAAATFSGAKNRDLAAKLESAMASAALMAHAEGVTDAKDIRARIMAAHDVVMNKSDRDDTKPKGGR